MAEHRREDEIRLSRDHTTDPVDQFAHAIRRNSVRWENPMNQLTKQANLLFVCLIIGIAPMVCVGQDRDITAEALMAVLDPMLLQGRVDRDANANRGKQGCSTSLNLTCFEVPRLCRSGKF